MGATKKGSFERALAVGRALERRQVIRDGSILDIFQGIKRRKKQRTCRTKDNIMSNLVNKYADGKINRAEYAEELVKTLPESTNTCQ